MLARGDGKVLVLLPYSYAQKVVPNSSKQQRGKRNLSFISSADMVSTDNINLHRFHCTFFVFLCFFDICTILFVYFSSASYCFHEEHSFIYLFIYFSSHIFSHLFPLSQRILQRFDEEGMLYLVPQGADDDWYWIYATVTDGREKTAYVVRMYAFCLFCICVLCT